MTITVGLLAVLLGIGLFLGGTAMGWEAHKRAEKSEKPSIPPMAEEERRRLMAEQEAFRQQMNYNAEAAYGLSQMSQKGDDSNWAI